MTKFVPSGLDEGEGMMAPDVEYVLKSLHHGVQLSRLQELYIQGGDSKPSRFPLSWASPNLRLLRCARYLPFTFNHIFFRVHLLLHAIRVIQLRFRGPGVVVVLGLNSKYF